MDTVESKGGRGLGADERGLMLTCTGEQEPLDYPRVRRKMADGQVYEEYVIPDKDRRKVFEKLYLFDNVPEMDTLMLDLHSNKTFRVSEYKAIRQGGGNFIVAPLYGQYGGTLLDWVSVQEVQAASASGVVTCCNSFRKHESGAGKEDARAVNPADDSQEVRLSVTFSAVGGEDGKQEQEH